MLLPIICIRRPVFTIVLSLMVIALGMIFFTKLQVRELPNIDPPLVTVQASYPGADAAYMERQVTQLIENSLKNIKHLKTISSTSATGSSNISLMFELNTDIEIALSDVRSAISDIVSALPEGMKQPSVSKLDMEAQPSFWISIDSDYYDSMELTRIADNEIRSVLDKLSTVGNTTLFGAKYYSMRIAPINAKMFQHKITPVEIEQAIRQQNKDYPAGNIKTTSRNFSLKLAGTLNSKEQFENIIIKKYTDGTIIKLKDVAHIALEPYDNDTILRYNGKQSIALGVVKQSTANVIELSNAVRQALVPIQKNLHGNVGLNVAYDAAIAVQESIKSVYYTIFEAIVLVGIVTYLFLGSIRLTIIPLITIPISLIGTFAVMYWFGFSINTFTLLAMILAVGLVVDDAIVVLENTFRHRHTYGKTSVQAAIDGTTEISFAILTMTITLAAVFIPIGLIEGFLGKLFIEFAWTLAFCVLFSGFIALTLTPMMCSRMVGDSGGQGVILVKFNSFITKIQELYIHALMYTMNHKKQFYLACALMIVILLGSFKYVHKIFIPAEDQGIIQIFFNGPEGASVADSVRTITEVEHILHNTPEAFGFLEIIGWDGGESGMVFVPLLDWKQRNRSQEQIKQVLNQQFAQIPGMSIFATSPPTIGGGHDNKDIEFKILSSLEYSELDLITQAFLAQMRNNQVLINSERLFKSSTPTFEIVVDREKAYRYGVSLETLGKTIQYLIAGKQVGDFRIGTNVYDVIFKRAIGERNKPLDLKKIFFRSETEQMIPIESVADIIETITVKQYDHYNNMRSITMTADIAEGKTLSEAIQEIDNIAQRILGGVGADKAKLQYVGQVQQMQESSHDTIMTFSFAILFIFLVLAAQFESFSDSLLILIAVPFSLAGGVLALLLCSNSINMYSNIGLITLIGLITKNSIMLVEFTNQLRLSGSKIKEALLEAAKLRLRPILMTSIATICGSLPLVFASGAGAAARNSIGLVIVGGMTVGTFFTIFVIPVLYYNFKKERSLVVTH